MGVQTGAVVVPNDTITFYAIDKVSAQKLRKTLEIYLPQVNTAEDILTLY